MKNTQVKKVAQITGWIAMAISVILAAIYYLGINNDARVSANFDLLLNWTFFLVIVIMIIAFIIGPILSILTNPKSLLKGLISVGVLLLVFLLGYIFTKADVTTVHLNYEVENLKQKLTFTEIGIISFYIIGGITILAILVSEVKSLLKL